MGERVEGVYSTLEEALRAVDRLREQGHSRENIRVIANEDVRNRFSKEVDMDVTSEDLSMDRTEETTTSQMRETHADDERSMDRIDEGQRETSDEDKSIWDYIKDAFTMDDSYDDPDYGTDDDPVNEYRDRINQGDVVVLVNDNNDTDVNITEDTTQANTQPNSIGPEGTRAPEDDLSAESREEEVKKDHELRRHEMDDYERKQ